MIKSLYKDYFQKSRVFLYPALDIKRGVSVTPIETYVSWHGHYTPEDAKLSCLYHLRNDEDFRLFEKNKLLGNRLFHEFKQVEDNKGVYVFDFKVHMVDWNHFLRGKYSKMSADFKKKIKTFTGYNSPDIPYVDSWLYPEKYYKFYAEMMGVNESLLQEVGELCSIPDVRHETLSVEILNLEFKKEML
jgi:hypothetical protein